MHVAGFVGGLVAGGWVCVGGSVAVVVFKASVGVSTLGVGCAVLVPVALDSAEVALDRELSPSCEPLWSSSLSFRTTPNTIPSTIAKTTIKRQLPHKALRFLRLGVDVM